MSPRHRKLLLAPPQPLICAQRKLALFFSAKAGCTFGVKWFFAQAGHLHTARYYHPWVHNFRRDVFYKSKGYDRAIPCLLDPSMRIIKLVRDPLLRAVSAYVHANITGYADKEMATIVKRPVTPRDRFSFAEFVSLLESENLKTTNIHHRVQRHQAERAGLVSPTHVVQLEESMTRLAEIEEELGLRKTDLTRFRESRHHTHRSASGAFCGYDALVLKDMPAVPPSTAFLNADLTKRVVQLYEEDYAEYGYPVPPQADGAR